MIPRSTTTTTDNNNTPTRTLPATNHSTGSGPHPTRTVQRIALMVKADVGCGHRMPAASVVLKPVRLAQQSVRLQGGDAHGDAGMRGWWYWGGIPMHTNAHRHITVVRYKAQQVRSHNAH